MVTPPMTDLTPEFTPGSHCWLHWHGLAEPITPRKDRTMTEWFKRPPPPMPKLYATIELIGGERVTGTCSVQPGDRTDPVQLLIEGITDGGSAIRLGLSPADARWLAAELVRIADLANPTRIRGWRDENA
jgi:hypothetical protein